MYSLYTMLGKDIFIRWVIHIEHNPSIFLFSLFSPPPYYLPLFSLTVPFLFFNSYTNTQLYIPIQNLKPTKRDKHGIFFLSETDLIEYIQLHHFPANNITPFPPMAEKNFIVYMCILTLFVFLVWNT